MNKLNFFAVTSLPSIFGIALVSAKRSLRLLLPFLIVSEFAVAESDARAAMLNLLDSINKTQAKMLSAETGVTDDASVAEGQRALAHMLETGLYFWLEANPDRPVFKQYVTTTRKLLGDNPDSVYYFAPIRDNKSYRIRGNVGAAVFTSFTVEGGSHDGHAARKSVSAISDEDMEIAADGSYEIIVSRDKPASGNWLQLKEGGSQVTTRHYHESKLSVAGDPNYGMDISIEALDPVPLANYDADADVAAKLNSVANFVREHAAMAMRPTSPEMAKQLGWYSIVPNKFPKPGQWISASGDQAYGNTHAYYAAAPYALAEDEALVIEGRFPESRFGNVVLWNRYMQSYDFANRQISLNRDQIHYEKDGSFRMVIAHKDPGVPNWLDTEGRPSGLVYWRYVFPRTEPKQVKARVVKLSSLKGK